MAIMKILALLVALLASACLAMAGSHEVTSPVPSRPENCGSNCCRRGFRCCTSPSGGSRCQSRFARIRCIRSSRCCDNPNNACAPQPPSPAPEPPVPEPLTPEPPLPEDDPNDDSECCAAGEECCNGSCVAKLDDEDPSGVQNFCLGRRGCCPPPPPSDVCEADCCSPGLDCVCGKCQVFLGFPVLCAADSGTCCGDPENPCATDV
eukprot:jgi/Ulvmu1/12081/UM084_0003.1